MRDEKGEDGREGGEKSRIHYGEKRDRNGGKVLVNAVGTRCERACFSILGSLSFEDERASNIDALSSYERLNNERIRKHVSKWDRRHVEEAMRIERYRYRWFFAA